MKILLVFCVLCSSLFSIAQQSPDSLKINNDLVFSPDSVKKIYDTSDKRPRNAYGDL